MKRMLKTTKGRFFFVVLLTALPALGLGLLASVVADLHWPYLWRVLVAFAAAFVILASFVSLRWNWIMAAGGPKPTDLNATVEQVGRSTTELVVPWPLMAPFGTDLSPTAVQEVWDAFVVPDQEEGRAQSVEMRALMAILRSMHAGMNPVETGWKPKQ